MPSGGVRSPEDVLNQAEEPLKGCSALGAFARRSTAGLAAKAQPNVYTGPVDLFWPPPMLKQSQPGLSR